MAYDVFISHSSKDKTIADAVCATLESHKIRCWIAPRDIPLGAEWDEAIVEGLAGCKVMVLVFSSHANESRQVKREVQIAFEGDAIVIPFRVENIAPSHGLKYYMHSVHWLDAVTPPMAAHLNTLATQIQLLLRRDPIVPPIDVGLRLGWRILLGSWILLGVSFLLPSLFLQQARVSVSSAPLYGWECANVSLHSLLPFLPHPPLEVIFLTSGLRAYVAGFTAVNALGMLSFPLTYISPVRQSPFWPRLAAAAAGYALSWAVYNAATFHKVAELRLGYFVWVVSLWGMAYGLARVRYSKVPFQPGI